MKRFTGKNAIQELIDIFKQELSNLSISFKGLLDNHKLDKNNPHMVSIGQIGAAPTVHTHDDRYYTESEINTKLSVINTRVEECFQSASDGKNAIVEALTGTGIKGTPPLYNDDFTVMANKIRNGFTLVPKTISLDTSKTSETVAPTGNEYGLSSVKASISPQEKSVNSNYGTTVITPDPGRVLSKATVVGPANKGAWISNTSGKGNTIIPEGYHNGEGYVNTDGAYNKGVTDADARVNTSSANYKGGYNQGVADADGRTNTNSANYKGGYNAGVAATKVGTAVASNVLSGKTFTNASTVGGSGSMANKSSTTVDASAVSQDNTYAYLTIPAAGYYDTNSKIRTALSNVGVTIENLKLFYNGDGPVTCTAKSKVSCRGKRTISNHDNSSTGHIAIAVCVNGVAMTWDKTYVDEFRGGSVSISWDGVVNAGDLVSIETKDLNNQGQATWDNPQPESGKDMLKSYGEVVSRSVVVVTA